MIDEGSINPRIEERLQEAKVHKSSSIRKNEEALEFVLRYITNCRIELRKLTPRVNVTIYADAGYSQKTTGYIEVETKEGDTTLEDNHPEMTLRLAELCGITTADAALLSKSLQDLMEECRKDRETLMERYGDIHLPPEGWHPLSKEVTWSCWLEHILLLLTAVPDKPHTYEVTVKAGMWDKRVPLMAKTLQKAAEEALWIVIATATDIKRAAECSLDKLGRHQSRREEAKKEEDDTEHEEAGEVVVQHDN